MSGTKSRQRVLAANSMAMYAPPGYLLFARDRTLMAQLFDAAKLQTVGDAVPIAEQVDAGTASDQYEFSVSRNGVLAYSSGGAPGAYQLTWTDRSGKVVGIAAPPGVYPDFRLAPDERRIAFNRMDVQSANQDIWVMDTTRGVTSRLTFEPTADNLPIWSPDGLRILYANNRSGVYDLYIKSATGAGQEELFIKMGTPTGWATSWSRDGRFVIYQVPGAKTGYDLWVAPQFGDRKPFPYLQTQFNEGEGAFSPDGRWVAYVSNESGRNEIYVQAFPLSGAKFQISTGGETEPTWRNDGSELFYRSSDGNLMAVPVKSGATFAAGVPKSLFPVRVAAGGVGRHNYAVSNDGQRFLVAGGAGGEKSVPLTVVLNWQAGLKK
jgi:Tol biopolymer transport system component